MNIHERSFFCCSKKNTKLFRATNCANESTLPVDTSSLTTTYDLDKKQAIQSDGCSLQSWRQISTPSGLLTPL